VLALIKKKIRLAYFVFTRRVPVTTQRVPGISFACSMVRQLDLHIISKMHFNAELYLPPTPDEKAKQPWLKYGDLLDDTHLPEALQCSSTTEDGYRIEAYHACCQHKQFACRLRL
jgi:hypothetical protein